MGAKPRAWELDALRGVMLVLMTLTHLPTRFSDPAGQPFGFVSAAEGFVMLSAYMSGIVNTQRERRAGPLDMRSAFLKRALKIYLCQAALLLFAFSVIAAIGVMAGQPAITNLLSYYLEQPAQAFVASLLLVYNPPLLDILPMYILFMLASPVVLLHGLHRGWTGILVASLLLWLAAQFGLGSATYALAVQLTGLRVPHSETGPFEFFAWQFLWVLGLWMGSLSVTERDTPRTPFPNWMVRVALVYVLVCLVWRHALGQSPFLGDQELNLLFDKWSLGPLRLIDFLSLLLLVMHFGPWLKTHVPRWRALETLGSASLPVFVAHLVLALSLLAVDGEIDPSRSLAVDALILMASFFALYVVARFTLELDQRAAAVGARLKGRPRAPLLQPGPDAPK